jgi:hypothetical protein
MARDPGTEIRLRLIIENPVPGVLYSLQKGELPFDPKLSKSGEALAFEFPIRLAEGPKFLGDFVRREGPERRFFYTRIGTLAGEPASPWTRRMKIDIHDIPAVLLEQALAGRLLETTVDGTAKDGSPACATIAGSGWRAV